MQPLSLQLNLAIHNVSSRLFPSGYDVSPDAPSTYTALKAHLDAGHRMIVFSGGSEHTIYADPEINYAFRAWHDWCHWIGEHRFTQEGEKAVCHMQCQQILADYGDTAETRRWRCILEAEIVGQNEYYYRHKRFVTDQVAFIGAYLRDPAAALSHSW